MLHAGVVDEDVDGAGSGFVAIHCRAHRRVVGGIEGERRHRGPCFRQSCLRASELRLVASVQDHARARAGEPFSQRMADALRRAGHQRGLAGQVEQFHSSRQRSESSLLFFVLDGPGGCYVC